MKETLWGHICIYCRENGNQGFEEGQMTGSKRVPAEGHTGQGHLCQRRGTSHTDQYRSSWWTCWKAWICQVDSLWRGSWGSAEPKNQKPWIQKLGREEVSAHSPGQGPSKLHQGEIMTQDQAEKMEVPSTHVPEEFFNISYPSHSLDT